MRLDARASLYCHEYLHKTNAPSLFDLSKLLTEDDPMIAELKIQGKKHESRVFEYLLSLDINVAQISNDVFSKEAQKRTAELLIDDSIEIILGAYIGEECEKALQQLIGIRTIEDSLRVSRPDVLIRVGIGERGFPIWAPVDIKAHNAFDNENKSNNVIISPCEKYLVVDGNTVKGKLDFEDSMQLAHYDTHLRNLGLAGSDHLVGVIGRDYSYIAWTYLDKTVKGRGKLAPSYLSIYFESFLEAESIVRKARERERNNQLPAVTVPVRIASGKFGCKVCVYRDVCYDELLSYDHGKGHVSLLPRVTRTFINEHLDGISNISELRLASGLSEQGMKAQIRADAWETGQPQLLDRDSGLVIPKFDIEIDIDLENSQGVLQEATESLDAVDDLVYLYGYSTFQHEQLSDIYSLDVNAIEDYENQSHGGLNVLKIMWEILKSRVEEAKTVGKSIGIFHYGSHEVTWWRRFARENEGSPGVPSPDEVESFVKNYFINLLPIAQKVAFRSSGYSIKDLAPLAGFSWQVSDPGGALSLLKYKAAISEDVHASERKEAQDWLRSYNADDVRATLAVRQYLRSINF